MMRELSSSCRLVFSDPPGLLEGALAVTNTHGSTNTSFIVRMVSLKLTNSLLAQNTSANLTADPWKGDPMLLSSPSSC